LIGEKADFIKRAARLELVHPRNLSKPNIGDLPYLSNLSDLPQHSAPDKKVQQITAKTFPIKK